MTIVPIDASTAAAAFESAATTSHSLRLFLVDGHPRGLVVADILNWSGKVLSAPRGGLDRLLKRPEASRCGLYIFTGPDPDRPGGDKAYIGEADDVATRIGVSLRQGWHDFFERLAVIVSSDDHLTKGHVRYLEGRLIRHAREAEVVALSNVTAPDYQLLPEADRASMDHFFDRLMLVLPMVGFDIFSQQRSAQHQDGDLSADSGPVFVFSTSGATARAQEIEDGFVVLAGSTARRQPSATFQARYRALRDRLLDEGKLVMEGAHQLRFTEDVVFTSPSAAAAVVAARSASGPREWKLEATGQAYMEWKADGLER
jgi:hypothetical protein